jgi:5'-methylthioadenosine phosphorylase
MDGGNVAVIGGTGFEQLPPEIFAEPIEVETRFGPARLLSLSNNYVEPYKLYFLSRHGAAHGLAPHQINYRANIAALVELEVKYVYATNAVGSLRMDFPPGRLCLFDNFLDFTRTRPLTYFAENDAWRHTDFTVPYSPLVRQSVLDAAAKIGLSVAPQATYVGCEGPRFETPAEIRLFAQVGGDVIGMTGVPEVIFAKEAGLEYAGLGIVTNFGAGLAQEAVDHSVVVEVMTNTISTVRELLLVASGILIEGLLRSKD